MEEENDKNDTIYSSEEDGNPTVMSEKVSNIAGNIYNEFERMIAKYDQEVVSGLMPLIVSVLEQLDMAYTDNNEQLVELEVLSDDNEQLITQYEREKQLRKLAENKYLEIEDQVEVEKREAFNLSDRLEHENKELESRVRGYLDHINRQDDRISEMKREYNTLHQRHSEIVHQYMERIERAEKKAITSNGDTPTTQKGLFRRRTNSGRSPVTPSASLQDLMQKGEGVVSMSPKSPDSEGPHHHFGSPENKNDLSLTEEQLVHTVGGGHEGPKVTIAGNIPALQVATHTAKVTGGVNDGVPVSSSNTRLYSSSMSSISSEKSEDSIPRGSRSSTESSGQNQDTSTCSITDINNMPIISMSEAECIIAPGQQSPNASFDERQWSSPLSKDAQAILASTPELESNTVVKRTSAGQTAAQRPISLDLENLPEGVEADSLFAELSSQEPEVIGVVDTGADITTIGKELENVLKENSQLLSAKNKLTTQKNDLLKRVEELSSEKEVVKGEMQSLKDFKSRHQARVTDLELELKRMRHDAEKATVALKEASVSAAHRKRFTRVEMARVLMERNQYKERLMELQEAVRWTEMIRASKERNLELQQKKKSSIWKFFSNLFGPTPKRPNPPTVSIRYGSPDDSAIGHHTSPVQPNERRSNSLTSLNTSTAPPAGFGSENFDRQRLSERRERYKQVRAYLNSDLSEGRMQAYGWSLPAKYAGESMDGSKDLISVPVPVYCRPLNLNDPGMKIWCAAGVDLSGGRTKDGGSAIGASVFYTDSYHDGEAGELKEATPSIIWIGSSTHSSSKVTIINANYPQNVLDCFVVCTSHLLCIAAVPGALEADYDSDTANGEEKSDSNQNSTGQTDAGRKKFSDPLGVQSSPTKAAAGGESPAAMDTATVKDVTTGDGSTEEVPVHERLKKMSSVLPTMWLGAQSGCVYVHSAISQWRSCIHSIRLKDSILSIVHVKGRVLVALADGTVAIFHRTAEGQWNFSNYHLLDLGRPHHSIRCMTVVHEKVWCGYRNKIQVIHPRTMRVEKTFDAHPRRESQVRQLAWIGDGVWVSIRLDSTLRLYNAHTYHHLQDIDIEPYVSKMLGTGKLGFSFVRITTLLLSNDRLWVGTGNGVILSIPLVAARPAKDDGEAPVMAGSPGTGVPGGAVRVYSNTGKDGESIPMGGSFMPYCSMVNAQLSFHGHRDSVKFFVTVPGTMKRVSSSTKSGSPSQTPSSSSPEKSQANKLMLMLSGGEGYVDFRLGDGEEACVEEQGDLISVTLKGQSTNERSHIMVWQVSYV